MATLVLMSCSSMDHEVLPDHLLQIRACESSDPGAEIDLDSIRNPRSKTVDTSSSAQKCSPSRPLPGSTLGQEV